MGQGIGRFRTRNGLSLRRREPGALMYRLPVDEAELLFRRYLCMCEHSVALHVCLSCGVYLNLYSDTGFG